MNHEHQALSGQSWPARRGRAHGRRGLDRSTAQGAGFLSYYVVTTGPNELISMTACLDEEALERVIQKSGEWVGTRLMMGLDVSLEESRLEKVVSHLG